MSRQPLKCSVWDTFLRVTLHDSNHFQPNTQESIYWLCTWNLKVMCTRDSPENLVKNFRNPFVSDVARSKQCWLIFSIFFWFSIESISIHILMVKSFLKKIVFDFLRSQNFSNFSSKIVLAMVKVEVAAMLMIFCCSCSLQNEFYVHLYCSTFSRSAQFN